jgi:HPr kinase/phosphorylase
MTDQGAIVHGTCVAIEGNAVLIVGPSGSGKSSLALQLLALGGVLVADDRTVLHRAGSTLVASPPPGIAGLIEARGVGLLPVAYLARVPVVLVVDMSTVEIDRLPQRHSTALLDIVLPCLHKVDAPYFPAAIHTYITGIRNEAR